MTSLVDKARKILLNLKKADAEYKCFIASNENEERRILEENKEKIDDNISSIIIIRAFE